MEQSAIKDELLEWLSQVNDKEVLDYLQTIKEEISESRDWYDNLGAVHKDGIERGLRDIQKGRTMPHSEVVKKYGLES